MTLRKSQSNLQAPTPVLFLPAFDPRKDDNRDRPEFVVISLSSAAVAELNALLQELQRLSVVLPGTSAIIRRDSTAIIVGPMHIQVEPQEWFNAQMTSRKLVLLMDSAVLKMIGHKVPVRVHVEEKEVFWDSHMGGPGETRLTSFRIPWNYLVRPLFLGMPRPNISQEFANLCEIDPFRATAFLLEGVQPDWGEGYRVQDYLRPADLECLLVHPDADVRQRALLSLGEFRI